MNIKVKNTGEVIDTEMLALLPTVSGSNVTISDVSNILEEDWYEDEERNLFMLYSEKIDIENDPVDAGILFSKNTEINEVGNDIKRFDGEIFYHA